MLETTIYNTAILISHEIVRFKDFSMRFTKLLDELGILWKYADYTNDIWIRDFMPIELDDCTFLKYRYYPDYLRDDKDYVKTITDCTQLCEELRIQFQETDIILDGGNVTPCGDYYVLTDKIFAENNRPKGDKALIAKLEKLLKKKVIIIPWHLIKQEDDPDGEYADVFGHSDGFIHWCGGNKVLMSNHRDTDPDEADEIKRILELYGFEVTEMLFNVRKPEPLWNWAYVNYIKVGNRIIMPAFGIEEDNQALKYVKEANPDCIIRQIRMRDIADKGGALHCITWDYTVSPEQLADYKQ